MSSQTPDSVRNRSNSVDDTELPTHDRKRPRLDTNEASHNPSIDARTSAEKPSSSPYIQRSPYFPSSPSINLKVSTPTSSKVTINTRPLSVLSMHEVNGAGSDDAIDPALILPITKPPSSPLQNGHMSGSTQGERSPSPPIEIAEPEDIDGDPSATRWTTQIGTSIPSVPLVSPTHVHQTFPFAASFQQGESHRAVTKLHKLIYRSQEDGRAMFRHFVLWLIDFTQDCDAMTEELLEGDRKFWSQLPDLFTGLWQFNIAPLFALSIQETSKALIAYGRLTGIMVEYDLLQLRRAQSDDDEVRPMTGYYLTPMSTIFKFCTTQADGRDSQFVAQLKRRGAEEVSKYLEPAAKALLGSKEVGLLTSLASYTEALGSALPKLSGLGSEVEFIVDATLLAMQTCYEVFFPPQFCVLSRDEVEKLEVLQTSETIARQLDSIVQVAIKKQSPWLNLKTAQYLTSKIGWIMRTLAVEIPALGRSIAQAATGTFEDEDFGFLDQVMPPAWLLLTLWKFIKFGRMELRVYGIDMMGVSLINCWREKIEHSSDGQSDPLVRFIVKFLRFHDIINYVIGPDSHPQLTGRAGNLVGFLGVAGVYTNADTDIMWKTILETPDPRIATEVLRTLENSLQAISTEHVYHVCEKLLRLPFERWNDDLHHFVCAVFQQLNNKLSFLHCGQTQVADPVVRSLCIKVIRDCLHPGACCTEMAQKLAPEFGSQLASCLCASPYNSASLDISAEEASVMFSNLRDDVACNSDYAGGALYAIYHIMQGVHLSPVLTVHVAEMCDLPSSLVLNIAHLVEHDGESKERGFFRQMDCRIKLLGRLVDVVPERFDLSSLDLMWSCLLANKTLDQRLRSQSWSILIARASDRTRNAVVDLVLQQFWSRLPAEVMDKAVLKFAEEAVEYDHRFHAPARTSSEGVLTIPGVDRVRQIMLRAPPGSVETAAAEFVINTYLRHQVMKQPKDVVQATHLALIDVSVSMVLGSASKLQSFSTGNENEDDMEVVIASQEEINESELCFDRSLLFLRRFTEAIKTRPGASPLHEDLLPEFSDRRGGRRDLIVEIGSSKYVAAGTRKMSFGVDNTGAELWQYLSDITGFSNFKVFHGGQLIALQHEQRSLAELKITAKVQVQKTPDTTETEPLMRMRSMSPVDEKIMLHFDALFGLLDADDRLAKEIYVFLSITSVKTQVGRNLRQMNTPASDVLAYSKPYKLLFTSQALRAEVETETLAIQPHAEFVAYAVQALLASCLKLCDSSLNLSIMEEVVDTLLLALRAKVPSGFGKSTYINDHSAVVRCLLQFVATVEKALPVPGTPHYLKSLRIGYDALVECALHDHRVWQHLEASDEFSQMLRLIVFHKDARVRQGFADSMAGITGHLGLKIAPKLDLRSARSRHDVSSVESTLERLWFWLRPLVAEVGKHSIDCREFLDVCAGLLKSVRMKLTAEAIASFYSLCQQLLLDHAHVEVVGRPLIDRLIAGLVPLLDTCARFLRDQNQLPRQGEFITHLLDQCMFPALTSGTVEQSTHSVIDSDVRSSIYSLMLTLCQQKDDLKKLVRAANEVVDENVAETCFNGDRVTLRADVGYAGLVNLSNTCYLNSLLSQLFMNLDFRRFILVKGNEQRGHSKLVFELAKVFAHMGGTISKEVDTTALVESIVTYDGDKIDVSVQMDVDEFFNLLTDRIESQLMNQHSRDAFKAFYGGQVIQQIKSMECEHVSERPEPFYVVPVEIKGKSSLEESLQAYVEGEFLQGDNKYHCSSCDKNVDAIKRSCFKQIPDHLIFNLKRFDYDILTFMRAKVNDRFEFPESIDMAPFSITGLTGEGSNDSLEPDVFDLTGIIVHSGTAETGHYYSFIRERGAMGPEALWVQFNDADVTRFDKNSIADCCFGGIDPSMLSMPKFYNAYMLFFTRRSQLRSIEQQYSASAYQMPPRIPGPCDVDAFIQSCNELHFRAYVVQDPAHAFFVRDTLIRLEELSEAGCSDSHDPEIAVFLLVLSYVTRVSMRWKSLPAVAETIRLLKTRMKRCLTCASLITNWLLEDRNRFVSCFVKNGYALARQEFAGLVLEGLTSIRDHQDDNYVDFIKLFAETFRSSWMAMTRVRPSWPEYFWLLGQASQLDFLSLAVIISTDMLTGFLDLFELHNMDSLNSALRKQYSDYLSNREKRREYNHVVMVHCFYLLLKDIHLQLPPKSNECERAYEPSEHQIGLSRTESSRLSLDQGLHWLENLILAGVVEQQVHRFTILLACKPRISAALAKMLLNGLELESMHLTANFLGPAETFLETCNDGGLVLRFAKGCLKNLNNIELDYGYEYLRFMQKCATVNNVVLGPGFTEPLMRDLVAIWGPPLLLGRNENNVEVRLEAYNLVYTSFIVPLVSACEDGGPEAEHLCKAARALLVKITQVAFQNFWHEGNLKHQAIEHDHFEYVLKTFEHCRKYAFPGCDDEELQQDPEYEDVRSFMTKMAKAQQQLDVVDLTGQNELDGSSDLEDLSDTGYDTDGVPP